MLRMDLLPQWPSNWTDNICNTRATYYHLRLSVLDLLAMPMASVVSLQTKLTNKRQRQKWESRRGSMMREIIRSI